jgi:tetratricopeptide (TPR) repeat protein
MPPSLSVCLIARNEAASLPRALQSVQSVADEVIVADTGSTDGTEQVARDLGAVVCRFPWCDDFSAARNHAISQAHGDWVFWLDADEELLPESVGAVRSCVARADALAFHIRRQDLQRADRLDYYTMMWQLRLFRRRDDLRFLGRCHPHFVPDIEDIAARTGLKVEESDVTIRHYGYVQEMRPAKLQRAARLLELELRERPGQLYYLVEYGRTLLMMGEERGHEILCQAFTQLLPHVGLAEAPTPVVLLLLEHLLQVEPQRLPSGVKPELIVDLARRWFPDSPPLLWILARQAAAKGRFAEAEQTLRRLLRMGKDHSYDQLVSFDPRFIGHDARLNLAVCLARQFRLEEARSLFVELLSSPEHAAQARASLELVDQCLRQSGAGGGRDSFPPGH